LRVKTLSRRVAEEAMRGRARRAEGRRQRCGRRANEKVDTVPRRGAERLEPVGVREAAAPERRAPGRANEEEAEQDAGGGERESDEQELLSERKKGARGGPKEGPHPAREKDGRGDRETEKRERAGEPAPGVAPPAKESAERRPDHPERDREKENKLAAVGGEDELAEKNDLREDRGETDRRESAPWERPTGNPLGGTSAWRS
jgi:hypothetical protein